MALLNCMSAAYDTTGKRLRLSVFNGSSTVFYKRLFNGFSVEEKGDSPASALDSSWPM
jgi:hypothetical protein